MSFLNVTTFCLAMIGHLGVWCSIFNQVHATSWPRSTRKLSEKLIYVIVTTLILLQCSRLFGGPGAEWQWLHWYHLICLLCFAVLFGRWLIRKWIGFELEELIEEQTRVVNIGRALNEPRMTGAQARLLGMVPFNQTFHLSIENRTIKLVRWPEPLSGIKIAHLTDFHFTGKVCREYFEEVVRLCNLEEPDFVFLTGDIVDSRECLGWLPETLGQLRAKSKNGKFYVLGNHDLRVRDESLLRREISRQGFERASGTWQVVEFNGAQFWIAGDELPWFGGAENLNVPEGPSVVLSHSPDRIFDVAKRNVDLVLAGHCHGGQIRLPIIGPVIAPSRHGVRFASGTFRIDSTLLHVSRGLSGDDPIRLNCSPELNIMTIQAGSAP